VSRGDDSGTHKKEQSLWRDAGVTPEGSWYLESGQGMGATLTMANERNAHTLKTRPWKVSIEGEVEKPGAYDLEDILKPHDLEERIYRFRCVEAWSMVVPWIGFSLADMLKRFEPTSNAKYVEFETQSGFNTWTTAPW